MASIEENCENNSPLTPDSLDSAAASPVKDSNGKPNPNGTDGIQDNKEEKKEKLPSKVDDKSHEKPSSEVKKRNLHKPDSLDSAAASPAKDSCGRLSSNGNDCIQDDKDEKEEKIPSKVENASHEKPASNAEVKKRTVHKPVSKEEFDFETRAVILNFFGHVPVPSLNTSSGSSERDSSGRSARMHSQTSRESSKSGGRRHKPRSSGEWSGLPHLPSMSIHEKLKYDHDQFKPSLEAQAGREAINRKSPRHGVPEDIQAWRQRDRSRDILVEVEDDDESEHCTSLPEPQKTLPPTPSQYLPEPNSSHSILQHSASDPTLRQDAKTGLDLVQSAGRPRYGVQHEGMLLDNVVALPRELSSEGSEDEPDALPWNSAAPQRPKYIDLGQGKHIGFGLSVDLVGQIGPEEEEEEELEAEKHEKGSKRGDIPRPPAPKAAPKAALDSKEKEMKSEDISPPRVAAMSGEEERKPGQHAGGSSVSPGSHNQAIRRSTSVGRGVRPRAVRRDIGSGLRDRVTPDREMVMHGRGEVTPGSDINSSSTSPGKENRSSDGHTNWSPGFRRHTWSTRGHYTIDSERGLYEARFARQHSNTSAKSEGSNYSEDSLMMSTHSSKGSAFCDVTTMEIDSVTPLVESRLLPPEVLDLKEELEEQFYELESSAASRGRSLSPESQVALYLSQIGDRVQEKYGPQLDRAFESVASHPREEVGFVEYSHVAGEMTEGTEGVTKLTLLMLLGKRLTYNLLSRGDRHISKVVDYTARLVGDQTASFIIEQGGWNSIKDIESEPQWPLDVDDVEPGLSSDEESLPLGPSPARNGPSVVDGDSTEHGAGMVDSFTSDVTLIGDTRDNPHDSPRDLNDNATGDMKFPNDLENNQISNSENNTANLNLTGLTREESNTTSSSLPSVRSSKSFDSFPTSTCEDDQAARASTLARGKSTEGARVRHTSGPRRGSGMLVLYPDHADPDCRNRAESTGFSPITSPNASQQDIMNRSENSRFSHNNIVQENPPENDSLDMPWTSADNHARVEGTMDPNLDLSQDVMLIRQISKELMEESERERERGSFYDNLALLLAGVVIVSVGVFLWRRIGGPSS